MNCEICTKKIGTLFLNKVLGTYVKDAQHKKRIICFECQKNNPDKATILERLSK